MHRLYLILLLLFSFSDAFGQEGTRRPLPAIKLETAPVIDGDPSDEIWKKVEPVTGFWDIQEGRVVAEQTRVRLAYNATHIFVAFEMTDSKPDEIISKETQEDSRFTNNAELAEDTVDVRFDTFSTNTSGGSSFFSINSIGTKSANLAGGRAKKTEWKGDWLAFAKHTPTGWTAEMQIPWGILNYPNQKAAQSFGINFFRYHARLKLPSYWANIGPQGREELQGIWTGVETPAPPKPKLSVLPYIITGFDAKTRPIVRTGFDARFPLSAEMTAVGSVNPDFGTIEGAVESVGFSRTERSVAERRPFFLEGQNFFRAGEGYDIGQFFYPRRIRSFDIGTKLYGKLNKKDSIGILQTMTIGERLDAVVNWSHKESPFETYGIFTNVKASRADNASVASVNYQKEWGKFAFSTRYAQSNDNGKSALASANTIWYSDKNNFSFLGYNDTNDKFRIPDGLIGFTGIKGWEFYDELQYEWRSGAVRQSNSEFSYSHNNKLDGTPFQRGGSANTFLGLRNGWGADLSGYYYDFDGLIDRELKVGIVKGWDNRFTKIGFEIGGGTNASEGAGSYAINLAQRISKGFDIGYRGFFENYQGHTQQNILTLAYELSPTRSLGGRVVTQNADTNWYLSYRNAGQKGAEWFAILGDPNSKKFRRMFQVKAVIPF